MLDFLAQILCWIKQIGAMVINAGVWLVNGFFALIEAIAQAAIDALPEMDEAPNFATLELPGGALLGDILGWINYVWPMTTFLLVLTTYYGLQFALWVAMIALRAVKAVE